MGCITQKLYFVEGDLEPGIACTYTGTDITGYTTQLHIRYEDGTTATIAGTITDAANGQFRFDWSAGDLVRGTHDLEIEVTDASARNITFPSETKLVAEVRRDIT